MNVYDIRSWNESEQRWQLEGTTTAVDDREAIAKWTDYPYHEHYRDMALVAIQMSY